MKVPNKAIYLCNIIFTGCMSFKELAPEVVKIVEYQNRGIRAVALERMAVGYIIRGTKLIYNNDSCTQISQGAMFMLGEGLHYEENVISNGEFVQVIFYISVSQLQRVVVSLSTNFGIDYKSDHICNDCRQKNFVVCTASPSLVDLFMAINRSLVRNDFRNSTAAQQIKLAELIFLILTGEDNCLRGRIVSSVDAACAQFTREIYNNIFNDISIEQLAEQTNRSLTSFKKEFRRQFDTPPHKWFVDQRLQRAKILLLSTNKTISEIGIECAFTNISHFIKLFKHRFNDTPAALRRKMATNRQEE